MASVVTLGAMLAAFAVVSATGRSAGGSGTAWFRGGVPRSWQPTTVQDQSGGAPKAAWRTPGPVRDGFYPVVFVTQESTSLSKHLGTEQWLGLLAQDATRNGWQPKDIDLADGAPALAVYVPHLMATGPEGGDVPVRLYCLYATKGNLFYRVTFMDEEGDYTQDQALVVPVLAKFRGTHALPGTVAS